MFENENYAYYPLTSAPSIYKELTVNTDGSLSFGKVVGEVSVADSAAAELSDESRYGDYQISISGLDLDINSDQVYGVVLGTKEGSSYGLRHLENIWRGTNLAWCAGITTSVHGSPTSSSHYRSIMGQTIDTITYYTSKGIIEIPADLYVPVKSLGYVLMNIPYADFYAAEVNNQVPVDGVSSATLGKPRTSTLAGGSYHVGSDGSDITGITFPVKVDKNVDLTGYKKVTDSDSVSITVTNRGQTTTTVYSGKDALFENESYAYYELNEN